MQSEGTGQVNYDLLDQVKLACIEASQKTLDFAGAFGRVINRRLGASANLFSLNLQPFQELGQQELLLTLVPEGLGTASDARPDDLSESELREFWWNIGIKSLAVMTNDAATVGAQPLAVGLYLPSSTPESVFTPAFLTGFLDGFVEGCRQVGCVYLAGETPQLKTKLIPGKIDIAGAVLAVVPPGAKEISSEQLSAGDSIVFVASSGPHENGFSVLRNLAERLPDGYRTKLPSGMEFWRAINKGSCLYAPLVQRVLAAGITPTNIENITGHGWQKIMRPKAALSYRISTLLPEHELFRSLGEWLELGAKELLEIFNCGVGYAFFTRTAAEAARVVELAHECKMQAVLAGRVEESDARRVVVEPLGLELSQEGFVLQK